jgi:hypothetical protein
MLPIKNKVAVLLTPSFDFSLVNSSDDISFIDCVLIAKSYQIFNKHVDREGSGDLYLHSQHSQS